MEKSDEEYVLVPRTLTPEMVVHLQMNTEIGAHICANWAGAYDCMYEYHAAMIKAAEQDAARRTKKRADGWAKGAPVVTSQTLPPVEFDGRKWKPTSS